MKNGLFLSFEGGDGAGKTTQIQRLARRLNGFFPVADPVLVVREPGGTGLGEKLRTILKDPDSKITPTAELLMFFAARAHLVETVIKPALATGRVVIADRFVDSSVAYQGWGRQINLNHIDSLIYMSINSVWPTLTFWLDVDWQSTVTRLGGDELRTVGDRFDSMGEQFAQKVNQGYRSLLEKDPSRMVRIDGNQDKDRVSFAIWKKLLERSYELRSLILGENTVDLTTEIPQK